MYKQYFREGNLNNIKNKIYKLFISGKTIPEALLDEVYQNDDIYTDNVKNREYIQFTDGSEKLRLVFNTSSDNYPLETIQIFKQDKKSHIGNNGVWVNIK